MSSGPGLRTAATASDLAGIVRRLGGEISLAYPEGVLMVAVLPGAVPFAADLTRAVRSPAEIDFLAISSYQPGTGRVRLTKDLDVDIHDRDVLVLEDIVDTGLTLNYVLGELSGRHPRTLSSCALLDRNRRRLVPVELDFVGLGVDDDMLIGYGLGHRGLYANLPALQAADFGPTSEDLESLLAGAFGPGAEPDSHR